MAFSLKVSEASGAIVASLDCSLHTAGDLYLVEPAFHGALHARLAEVSRQLRIKREKEEAWTGRFWHYSLYHIIQRGGVNEDAVADMRATRTGPADSPCNLLAKVPLACLANSWPGVGGAVFHYGFKSHNRGQARYAARDQGEFFVIVNNNWLSGVVRFYQLHSTGRLLRFHILHHRLPWSALRWYEVVIMCRWIDAYFQRDEWRRIAFQITE